MPAIGRRSPCIGGKQLSKPCVYGWRGDRNSAVAGADSTSRPAYMTAISSASSTSSDRSCVMNSAANPSRSRSAHELLEDLALRDHVEGGGRLVEDEHLRLERQRHRDHGPLAHAA